MADYKSIEYDQSGNIARITLNRPDAANSLNDVMVRDLQSQRHAATATQR